MIKAIELRLRNWVQVVGIYKSSILRAGLVRVDAELILLVEAGKILVLGIPLTPELLEKAGFNKKGYLHIGEQWLKHYEGVISCCGFDACTEGHCFNVEMKYVHQLQNLYFALTGEELKIEL